MGWPADPKQKQFKGVWITVMLVGLSFALIGTAPITMIMVAQAANAVILPLMAVALV